MSKSVQLQLVAAKNGFDDFDVIGHNSVHRVCIGHGIKNGDAFNVYSRSGRKHGAIWCGSVELSLCKHLSVDSISVKKTCEVEIASSQAIFSKYAGQRALDESNIRVGMSATDVVAMAILCHALQLAMIHEMGVSRTDFVTQMKPWGTDAAILILNSESAYLQETSLHDSAWIQLTPAGSEELAKLKCIPDVSSCVDAMIGPQGKAFLASHTSSDQFVHSVTVEQVSA